MHTDSLPTPIVPADLDLRTVPAILLDVARLRDSELAGDHLALGFAVLLWAASWHQVPCSSLPNDDKVLARMVGLGRDVEAWMQMRDRALHGFILCSDGRLYHPVVAEKALEFMGTKEKRSAHGRRAATKRWHARALQEQCLSNADVVQLHSSGNAQNANLTELNKKKTVNREVHNSDSQYGKSERTRPLVIEKIATSSLRAANSLDPIKARNGSVSVLVPETVDAFNGIEGHDGTTPDIETLQ